MAFFLQFYLSIYRVCFFKKFYNNNYICSCIIPSLQVSHDYLETLEKVKKQYQQYVEVSDLYKLPTQNEEEAIKYQPPTPEHPLTTNTFRVK